MNKFSSISFSYGTQQPANRMVRWLFVHPKLKPAQSRSPFRCSKARATLVLALFPFAQ